MKSISVIGLTLVLLLCACAPAVPEATETPVASPEQTGTSKPELSSPSGVFTDWSLLTDYEPAENIYTRLAEGPIEELVPSKDYGLLLPFTGERLQGEYGYQIGAKVGLITQDGCIVLDAVCGSISRASYYDYATMEHGEFDIYVLSKYVEDPESYYGYKIVSAFAAADGSWVTDFEFSNENHFSGTSMGALGVLGGESNQVLVYDERGNIVIDTREFEDLDKLQEYSLSWYLTGYENGLMPVNLKTGNMGLLNLNTGLLLRGEDGEIVSYRFIGGFNSGLAPAETPYGQAGYINASGNWVIEPEFDLAGNFSNGIAVVRQSGSYSVIGVNGEILMDAGDIDAKDVFLEGSGENTLICVYGTGEQENAFYDVNLNLIEIDGRPAARANDFFYIITDEGAKVLIDGETVLLPGATAMAYSDGRTAICAVMEDESTAVFDLRGRLIAQAPGQHIAIGVDSVTGEEYIAMCPTSGGTYTIYDLNMKKLVTGAAAASPTNGLFRCSDAVSEGYKNTDNEWVFRILLNADD